MSHPGDEILVPVDGSDNANRAAQFAASMASALDVPMRLFSVFPAASVEVIGMAGMSRNDIDRVAQAAAQRAFDSTREALGDAAPKNIEEETAIGDPAEEEVRYTEDDPGMTVIMGRGGLSRMRRSLTGRD